MAVLKVKENNEWKEILAIKGADGHTPEKGVDYFTEEDIASLNIPEKVSDLTNDAGYTTNEGTITSVKMNGNTISTSGEADLGTVITAHQDISGKQDKEAGKGLSENNFTDEDKANLDSNTATRHTHTNKQILDTTTASYTTVDKANLDNNTAARHTHTNKSVLDTINGFKTINNQSILGSGNIDLDGGGITTLPYQREINIFDLDTGIYNVDMPSEGDVFIVVYDGDETVAFNWGFGLISVNRITLEGIEVVSYDFTGEGRPVYNISGYIIKEGQNIYGDVFYFSQAEFDYKQNKITSSHKLLSDLVDDTNQTNKFVTAQEKTTWNNKQNTIDSTHKLASDLIDTTNQANQFVTTTEKTNWNNKADAGFTGIITGTSSNPTDGASLPVGVYKASDNQNISYINLIMEDGTTKRQSVQKGGIVIRTAARLEIFATQNLMYQYDTTNEYFYPAENFIESNLRRDYEAEGGYASLGTVSPPNNIFITSPINTLEATINTGEIGHSRIIFSVEDGIAKGDFGLSLTDTDGNDLIYNNGALPKPVAGESWIFDFVGNRCNATLYKSTYLDWDRDEQILFLVRSNSDQIYYPSLDSKPSITVQSAKGSTDPGRPVVMEYSEPFLTSFQDVEYYGIPKFIPLDLSLYNTSTQANMLHPHSQLPDGNYWVKSPGRMWVAGESYQLVGKEQIYKKGDVLGINGGEYTAAYYAWDSTENDYKGGFFTTYQDVMDAISEINYEPGLTVVRQTTTTGTTTVNNGKWNKKTNNVNSMTLAMANLTEIPDTFKARVTVQTSATFTSFNISQRTAFTVYFAGWDCTNGVLAGKPNAFYNIDYRADGKGNIIAMVTGYDVPNT